MRARMFLLNLVLSVYTLIGATWDGTLLTIPTLMALFGLIAWWSTGRTVGAGFR